MWNIVNMDSSTEHWDPALTRLLTSLKEVQSGGEDVAFLSELLQSKQLHALVQVHNKIVAKGKDDKFYPLLSNAMQVTLEVFELLHDVVSVSKEYRELLNLLQKPHFQAILCTHDAVAQKDYYPHLPDVPPELDDEEETVKIVQLVKSDEPLGGAQSAEPIVGATIKTDEETGKIVIARVMHGGAADRSGLIHAGDEVIEVNGISVENKTPADVWQARREGDRVMRAGLIPSRALQEGRIIHERQTDPQTLDGRVCVLSPHWQALKMLRTPRLRPYIVFIRPPSHERLIETRTAANARSTFDKECSRAFTEEELSDIVRSSNRINFLYGYMFDEEIVNEDLASALSKLLKTAWRVQSEPLWVPASWVQ
ncbi:unnamed protein product [Spodoptera exigua]|nr:unnamed protein product [Spodoptera exigua]